MNTKAAKDVLVERQRQVTDEGWSFKHDDYHADGALSAAAACYLLHGNSRNPFKQDWFPFWPWDNGYIQKPKSTRRNLVRAGAMILAEIERIDRKEALK
jgi:hypothetical protein